MVIFRVLFTPPRIGDIGGVEAHTMQLAEQLAKRKISVSIICASEPKGSRGNIKKYAKLKLLRTAFKIQNTNITLGLPFAILKEKVDIIHTMVPTPWSSDWSALLAKLFGKKIVVTIHSDLYSPSFVGGLITKIYVETFYRLLLSIVDKIIIVNPGYKKTFKHNRHVLEKVAYKIVAIPNGVDTKRFNPLERKKTGKNILFVSILDDYHEFKGFPYLLRAMPNVLKKSPDAKLTIVGKGPLKAKYKKMAQEIGISKKVSFVGEKSNKKLPAIYASSDVFVLPSIDTESFGIVLLESMSCGTPVVTTEYAGMRKQIVKENCGIVVKSRDSEALADAITKILGNDSLRKKMGKNGRKMVEENYSWEKIAAQTIKVYEGLVRK